MKPQIIVCLALLAAITSIYGQGEARDGVAVGSKPASFP